MEGEKVVSLAYLGSGMTLKRKARISFGHSLSVVDDLNRGASGINDDDVDGIGLSIHSILDQFLNDTGRTLNHLTCGNLVGDAIG